MIPDNLDRHDPRQFGLSGLFTRFVEPLTRRSEPGEQTTTVDEADIQLAEAYDVVATLQLGNADELIHQGFADEDKLAVPFDLAGAADPAGLVVGVVPGISLAIWHDALGSSIGLGGRALAQRFMRKPVVKKLVGRFYLEDRGDYQRERAMLNSSVKDAFSTPSAERRAVLRTLTHDMHKDGRSRSMGGVGPRRLFFKKGIASSVLK